MPTASAVNTYLPHPIIIANFIHVKAKISFD